MDETYLDEEWREIDGWPDYLVSDHGRVWSLRTLILMRLTLHDHGYLRVFLRRNGDARWFMVHRLVAEAFLGQGYGRQVNHIDGDKTYNHVSNLEWVTQSRNIKHSYEIGFRKPSGGLPPRRVEIIETGEVFESLSAAARYIDGDSGNIANCLQGRQRKHKGYSFNYVEE
jgi:hypothetical protein